MEGEECCAAEESNDNMDSFVDIMNISMKELSIGMSDFP